MVQARIVAALALFAASCVQFEWESSSTHWRVDAADIGRLTPGESDLGACLDALGAPLYVWEYAGDGVALAFGAGRGRRFDINISIPLDQGSAPVDFAERNAQTLGWVLFFDEDWKLVRVREGRLRDLARGFERRPAPLEED